MKRAAISIITAVVILMACHKRSIPVITERTTEPAKPQTEIIRTIPDAEAGRIVFMNCCGRCHGLPETNVYTAKRWETILILMAPRARLTKNEMQDVMAHIHMHSKKE